MNYSVHGMAEGCLAPVFPVFQGESAGGLSGLHFTVAPDGQADRVLIENLNVDGQGVFLRVKKD